MPAARIGGPILPPLGAHVAAVALALAGPALGAAPSEEALGTPVGPITVIDSTPVPGSGVNPDRIPSAVRVLDPSEINRTGVPSLTGAFLESIPSATVNDVEGNAFQPDILFRGFTASPVAGTPEGLAVYVNGARFNDAFGDTVNWDLIPPQAIESVTLDASDPLFGLNALGGSVNVRLKTGFSGAPDSVTAYRGAYGRAAAIVEFSRRAGPFALYATGDVIHDDGFRQTSASDLRRIYADLGWRGDGGELHLAVTGADNTLGNPGATPVQALNAELSNIFTAPNAVTNQYLAATLRGAWRLTPTTAVQGAAYAQTLTQRIPNGITEEVDPCDDGTGLLCNPDGAVVTGVGGAPVSDFLNGATYSGLSVQKLVTHAYGAALQATNTLALAGHANRLTVGVSYDGSDSVFAGSQAIGGFNPYTREFIGPGVIQDQPSEGVNPVRVLSVTRFWGVFAQDVLALTPKLDLTLAGRFNDARIDLEDQLGGPVNGAHDYSRFNPSAGLSWRLAPWVRLHGRYAETNRAPTPQELSCASAATPCSLLNFFVGDPNLDQVVARTAEAGAGGDVRDVLGGRVSWTVDYYHTDNTNDIIYETTVYNPNLAFYANAGKTRRQGVEATVRYTGRRLDVSLGYAWTDATFRTPLLLTSGSNPNADVNGDIQVVPGDHIPGIAAHRADLTFSYAVTRRWTIGGSVIAQSSAWRFGDEANLTKPVGGYAVVDLNTAWKVSDRITVFALLNNAFNARYDTYGGFGPVDDVPWPNVPGGVTDPRTASPGAPIAGYGGVKLTF
jgi:outer membrane receptor protein involved in Fe transport